VPGQENGDGAGDNGGGSSSTVVVVISLILIGAIAIGLVFFRRSRKSAETNNGLKDPLLLNDHGDDAFELGVIAALPLASDDKTSAAKPISHLRSSISTASNVSASEENRSEKTQSGQNKSDTAALGQVVAVPIITMLEQVETFRIRLGFQIAVRVGPGSSAKTGSMLLQGSMFEVDQKSSSTTDNQVFLHAVDAGWVGQYHPQSDQPICERAWSTDRSEVDFDMLKHATNGFKESQAIGDGGSCTVYRATVDGIPCAIKVLAAGAAGWEAEQFAAEVNLLRRVHHPNLCRLYASSTNGPSKCLVLELMEGGALDRPGHMPRSSVPALAEPANDSP
jgi:hypothetical protein